MKVAIFGCLHGMLDAMYYEIELHERNHGITIDLVIVCGDCQTLRHFDDMRCLSVPQKYKKLGDFHDYYSGKKKVPKLTIFVGGNHEASNYLMTLPYGGWVCDNFYYLGYAGVVRYNGLRIAGVSGIYNYHNCNRGRYEQMPLDRDSIKSVYHTRRLDIFRLQLLSKNADTDPIDVFLSHDWPAKIYDHGNKQQLLRFKPAFRSDMESRNGLGSPLTQPLVNQLKPKRWFAAHLHCKFYAQVTHDPANGRKTEFLSLNKIENRMNFMEVIGMEPSKSDGAILDNELYHDPEWLTIIRKTVDLEKDSSNNVYCPNITEDRGKVYFPTEEEIQTTIDLMNKSGGLKIVKNFKMSEPVIYDRPDKGPPSLDNRREQYFPNPQNEELVVRLELRRGRKRDNSEIS